MSGQVNVNICALNFIFIQLTPIDLDQSESQSYEKRQVIHVHINIKKTIKTLKIKSIRIKCISLFQLRTPSPPPPHLKASLCIHIDYGTTLATCINIIAQCLYIVKFTIATHFLNFVFILTCLEIIKVDDTPNGRSP